MVTLEQLAEADHLAANGNVTHALTLRHGRDSVRAVTRARWILIALVCASIVAIGIALYVLKGAFAIFREAWARLKAGTSFSTIALKATCAAASSFSSMSSTCSDESVGLKSAPPASSTRPSGRSVAVVSRMRSTW